MFFKRKGRVRNFLTLFLYFYKGEIMKRVIILCLIIFNISFAYKYNRIASLTLSGDEMILDLVEDNRIIGLSGRINKDKDVSNIWNKGDKYTAIENNIETLISLEPDLIITADWKNKELFLQAEELGTKIFVYKTPKNFEEQKDLILELSTILEEKEKGNKIVSDMETRLKILQEKIKNVKSYTPKVLLYTSFETTAGKNTTFDNMIELIGGENLAKTIGITGEEKISKEKLIELDPEIIIIPLWSGDINSEEFINFIRNDESLKDVQAVKSKKVYAVLYKKLTPTSQYMIDGIEELGNRIYNLEKENL